MLALLALLLALLLRGVVTSDNTPVSHTETLPSHTLKCKLINARSLNNKLHQLQHVLNTENLDLLICSETWFKPYTPDSVIVADTNYSVFRKDRLLTTAGGACIFIKNDSVKAVRVAIPETFKDLEVVAIDIVNSSIPTRIIACYRPPSSDTDSVAISHIKLLINCLESLCDIDATVVIAGDLNLPWVDWSNPVFISDNGRCSTKFTEFINLFAFTQYVKEPTRININKDSGAVTAKLLDVVLCNDVFAISDVAVEAPFSTSDHCSVGFNIVCHVPSVTHDFEYNNFTSADWDAINAALNDVDWNAVFNSCTTVDDFSTVFYNVLYDCINKFVPTRTSKGSKNKSHVKYPAYVKRLLRKKQAVWRRLKTFRTVALKAEFRAISARCREAIHRSARQFEESIIDSGNLGRFFRYANSKLVGKKNVGPLQRPDGSVTVEPDVKARLLSDFFQTLFTRDNGSVPAAADLPGASPSGLSHISFTPNFVRRIINKLKLKSAGGPDGIPPIFLKKCCIELCSPLAFLFQLFFDNSFLPPVWLQAFITPVLKKGDPTKPCNYRPISLTCSICKVMECIIKDQLVAYLAAKGLGPVAQSLPNSPLT